MHEYGERSVVVQFSPCHEVNIFDVRFVSRDLVLATEFFTIFHNIT